MSSSIQVCALDRLPADGCLIIPGHLTPRQANELAKSLTGRTITWLVEESAIITKEMEAFLKLSGFPGAAFSKDDPSLSDVGANLFQKIQGNGVLIFVPGEVNARPGAVSHIPSETLNALCLLGLPISPLHVSRPSEISLTTEGKTDLPDSVLTFSHPL